MHNTQYVDTIRDLTSRPVQSLAAKQVMGYINSLMKTVSIDTEAVARELEAAIMDDSSSDGGIRKLVNTLARLFGLSLVSRDDCLKFSSSALEVKEGAQLLQVDQQKASNIISAIASVVEDCEQSRDNALQRIDQMEGILTTVSREADSAKQEQNSLRKTQDRKDRDILKSVQRILAQNPGLKPAEEGEKDALLLFLEDMELTWSWDADASPDDFTTYVISDPEQTGVRMPCVYRDGELVVKGLRYSLGG